MDMSVISFIRNSRHSNKRDDDKSGLGDWYTNEKKLGFSLKELSAEVHKKEYNSVSG